MTYAIRTGYETFLNESFSNCAFTFFGKQDENTVEKYSSFR